MGTVFTSDNAKTVFERWREEYDIYAPVLKKGDGCFSDTDVIRYDKVTNPDEIVWDKKSDYSFKEVLLPINTTLFYFTEKETTVPAAPEKDILIFLRACDRHAVKRLDQVYLNNKFGDFYYARLREKTHFVLMECPSSCESGFCVSMGTNKTDETDAFMKPTEGGYYYIEAKEERLAHALKNVQGTSSVQTPGCPVENQEKVMLPQNLSNESFTLDIWKEYGARCIACGRCNFVCPTCTCYTMQDIFYKDNENVGERRRVWASCEVDGYTQIAGGHEFRKDKADRMRFKVMHKIYDYEKRFGYPMCVGCGRCDAICPEYISYSNLVNRLAKKEEA